MLPERYRAPTLVPLPGGRSLGSGAGWIQSGGGVTISELAGLMIFPDRCSVRTLLATCAGRPERHMHPPTKAPPGFARKRVFNFSRSRGLGHALASVLECGTLASLRVFQPVRWKPMRANVPTAAMSGTPTRTAPAAASAAMRSRNDRATHAPTVVGSAPHAPSSARRPAGG